MVLEHPRRSVELPRRPSRLLFSLLGELIESGVRGAVPAPVYLRVLAGTGVAGPTARAALDRLVVTGYLERSRSGRSVSYGLTSYGREVMDEARIRVFDPNPFSPNGEGWTLVAFSLPEELRGLRQQIRTALTWEGFAPLRDGFWIAPGAVDLRVLLDPYREELPQGAVLAFRGREVPGFAVAAAIGGSWDLPAIRRAHEAFLASWEDLPPPEDGWQALTRLVELGSDWTTLLGVDPRLPSDYLDDGWPATRSADTRRRVREGLLGPAHVVLRELTASPRS